MVGKERTGREVDMPSIAILTDSDSSLPAEVAARYEIEQVPITVHFGDEMFRTGVDINDHQLFERIRHEGRLPTTAAPSPGDFAAHYQRALDKGSESIVCFCVSSEVSGTYQAAVSAAELLPEADITVVDTLSLSIGQGFMVLAAAEAARAGASKQEVVEAAAAVRERTFLYAALSTLKYLAMSGRVGHLAAGMASVLSIKPILTIREGRLDMLEKVRTQRKSWARVFELAHGATKGKPIERLAILHVDALEDAQRFQALLCEQLACPPEILVAELTAGLSVHAGAGLVGVSGIVAP
jgi:DegV family protein with EDD domain